MTSPIRIDAMRGVVAVLAEALAVTDPIDTLSAIRVEEALLQVRAWLAARDDGFRTSDL